MSINWGDGSDPDGDTVVGETFVVGQSESTGEISLSLAGLHTYTAFGAHTITATVTDSYGASSSALPLGSGPVTVGATASVTYDPVWGITLDIRGTNLADVITVNQTGGGSQIIVHTNSGPDTVFSAGPYTIVSPTGPNHTNEPHTGNIAKIRIHLCGGDDHATVSSGVIPGVIIFGEGGNDHINAGKADAIVLGGDGDDDLVGGAGLDLQIGGNGADRIVGGAGDDILIAGYTSYDKDADGNDAVNERALKAIMSVWNTNNSYVNRVAAVQDTNAPYNLLVDTATTGSGNRTQTVFSDNDEDKLTGSAGYDLFFANLVADDDVATVLDKITDLNSKLHETALDIDWS